MHLNIGADQLDQKSKTRICGMLEMKEEAT